MPPPDPLIGQTLDGYRIDRMIGKGSMGMVYHAVDVDSRAQVAVKTMTADGAGDQELLQRFQREARVANEIKHPNVAHVLLASFHGEMPYLVMEFIDGPALSDLLKQKGALDAATAVNFIKQAAAGLKAANEHGSIHRDIKPANIMVTSKGVVKIVDFGIARNENDSLRTAVGTVMGSPYYMSPEQSAAKPLDHRSDMFGLGATFYHLLSGHPPFEGKNLVDVIQKRSKGELVPIQTYSPNVPAKVSEICYKMMKTNPAERYQNYDDLIRDLNGLQAAPAPKPARPEPPPESEFETRRVQVPVPPKPAVQRPAQPIPPPPRPAPPPPEPEYAGFQQQQTSWLDSDIIPFVLIGLGALLILGTIFMLIF